MRAHGRLFGVMLLCLALVGQGVAQARAAIALCQSSGHVALAGSAGTTTMPSMHGDHACCDDADTAAHPAKPCKMGGDCQSLSLIALASVQCAAPAAIASNPIHIGTHLAPAHSRSSVWRPPALT